MDQVWLLFLVVLANALTAALTAIAILRGRRLRAQRAAIGSLARAIGADGTARAHLCDAAASIAEAGFACLLEPEAEGTALVVTAAVDVDLEGRQIGLHEPAASVAAFRSGQGVHLADLAAERHFDVSVVRGTGARAARFEPVFSGERVVGVLVVAWPRRHDELPEDTGDLLRLLAREAARAIEHDARVGALAQMARTDALTGLPNRRAWDELLEREAARARRTGGPLSLALLDLDHFKAYNDEHGHQAGDALLREAAVAWRTQLREQDALARYGGEEFGVLLPDTPIGAARDAVERVRRATPGGQTASAGVVEVMPGESPQQAVRRADAALYRAKSAGRAVTVPA